MDAIILQMGGWSPVVHRRGAQLFYEMPVASGHADRHFSFEIKARDLAVLEQDAERYWCLYAALHHPYQLKETELGPAMRAKYFETILHGTPKQAEAFLTQLDHGAAKGAISNLVSICMKRDQAPMRAGQWLTNPHP
ncbi:hypothetical protein IV417_18125 [Alphaproteobacteria bacterium KMM 3653]|uniref:Uncharacterized protein n=1 Tax=Harenicola maris TaxID=2841044 RepID=A0AAP2CTJ7_9RHOB|nr:hypothetical protein [Harenicola maris]